MAETLSNFQSHSAACAGVVGRFLRQKTLFPEQELERSTRQSAYIPAYQLVKAFFDKPCRPKRRRFFVLRINPDSISHSIIRLFFI